MTLKCFSCGIMYLFFLCLLVILPIVGLIFWAILLKTPEEFLLMSISISVLWMGLGIGFYFVKYGIGKCRQLSKD